MNSLAHLQESQNDNDDNDDDDDDNDNNNTTFQRSKWLGKQRL